MNLNYYIHMEEYILITTKRALLCPEFPKSTIFLHFFVKSTIFHQKKVAKQMMQLAQNLLIVVDGNAIPFQVKRREIQMS